MIFSRRDKFGEDWCNSPWHLFFNREAKPFTTGFLRMSSAYNFETLLNSPKRYLEDILKNRVYTLWPSFILFSNVKNSLNFLFFLPFLEFYQFCLCCTLPRQPTDCHNNNKFSNYCSEYLCCSAKRNIYLRIHRFWPFPSVYKVQFWLFIYILVCESFVLKIFMTLKQV